MGKRSGLLTQVIYKKLIYEIRNGILKEGTLITEAEQASRFNVSKTPAREALHLLESEGLLIRLPHKGYMLKGLSAKEIREMCQLRTILETGAVELAIENASDEEIQRINNHIVVLPNHDIESYIEINMNFHTEIARASHNKMLEDMLSKSLTKMMFVSANDLKTLDIEMATQTHVEISKAIEQRNVELSKRLISKHILEAQHRFLGLK